jgi:hypothetical protein
MVNILIKIVPEDKGEGHIVLVMRGILGYKIEKRNMS